MGKIMNTGIICIGLLCGLAHWVVATDEQWEGEAKAMRDAIRNYHADAVPSRRLLHVVYFHPADVEPQPGFRERITRIMLDIQDFYRTEMARNGFGDAGLPLDMTNGTVRVHVVAGRDRADGYSYQSGGKVRAELRRALQGPFDIDTEFVMVFEGMCRKVEENRYFFYAPYYGDPASDHRHGLCHAADCELLDPQWLTETKRMMAYEEHTGSFRQTFAAFNTKYLGGVAHELGHALSLPHESQAAAEVARLGTSLMGGGNHTYRREKWDGQGSFLARASAARLASHPLFTGSDRGRDEPVMCDLTNLRFDGNGRDLKITGRVTARPEAYGVIAYVDPPGGDDYDALAYLAPVRNGAFQIPAHCERPGRHSLRLAVCHVNGATSPTTFRFSANDQREPDRDALTAQWVVRAPEQAYLRGQVTEAVERARALLAASDTPAAAARKLRHMLELAAPKPSPVRPAEAVGDTLFLSDLRWSAATVGWGKPARNQYYCDDHLHDALFLELDGTFYEKGLYAHAPSRYVFDLAGKFKTFRARVGLQTGVAAVGTARFIVNGDGKELYRSGVLKEQQTEAPTVDVRDVNQLELIVESGKEGNACCWAVWANPQILR